MALLKASILDEQKTSLCEPSKVTLTWPRRVAKNELDVGFVLGDKDGLVEVKIISGEVAR